MFNLMITDSCQTEHVDPYYHNSQKVGTARVSTDIQTDTENVVHTYSGTSSASRRREMLMPAATWMNSEDIWSASESASLKRAHRREST